MRQDGSQHGEGCDRVNVRQGFEKSALVAAPADCRQNFEQQLFECTCTFS